MSYGCTMPDREIVVFIELHRKQKCWLHSLSLGKRNLGSSAFDSQYIPRIPSFDLFEAFKREHMRGKTLAHRATCLPVHANDSI